jgi:hypothetical protein
VAVVHRAGVAVTIAMTVIAMTRTKKMTIDALSVVAFVGVYGLDFCHQSSPWFMVCGSETLTF